MLKRLPVIALTVLSAACSGPSSTPAPASEAPVEKLEAAARAGVDDEPLPPPPSPYETLPDNLRGIIDQPFKGDFDQMVKRRLIRIGVVYNRAYYFIDHGEPRGLSYDAIKLFDEQVNKRLKTGTLRISVAIVPMSREQLFPALENGLVDAVVAALTVTPEREKRVDFSNPTRKDINQIVVTPANAPNMASAEELSGKDVFVRLSSSYNEHLQDLNKTLVAKGKAPINIVEAPEALEDDDILEMVNAGLVDATVVNDFAAKFWSQVFPTLKLHTSATVAKGQKLAIGIRKQRPKMMGVVNTFVKENGPRSTFGNMMDKRYLTNAAYVRDANSEAERKKLLDLVKMFQTYGDKYNVDALLMAAQGYQESRLDQNVKSKVGAIGIMQVMPKTGKELAVGDISKIEPNIHAGVKYFRFMVDQFFKDEPMDPLNKGLMTLASYNAGPNRIRQLRKETEKRGLNPNVWFGNVERVVAERVGSETVTYVSNIYKYYVAYKLVLAQRQATQKARESIKSSQ